MCDDPAAPDAAAGAELPMQRLTIVSNDGSYRLTIEPETGGIPRNRYFALNTTIEGVHDPIDPERVALSVSGGMPHHEHGLNTRPIVDIVDPSPVDRTPQTMSARVHGLLLHMPGRWELYFDITEAGMTERAQFTIELP